MAARTIGLTDKVISERKKADAEKSKAEKSVKEKPTGK